MNNKRILFISNMFPSARNPSFGIFIKKNLETLALNFPIADKILIRGIGKTKLGKFRRYLFFYSHFIFSGIFKRYDLIYVHYVTHLVPALYLIKPFLKRKGLIINFHGGDLKPVYHFEKKIQRYTDFWVNRAILIVVPSPFFRDEVLIRYPSVDMKRIIIYPSGGIKINSSYLHTRSNSIRASNQLATDTVLIGYVSRISVGKGWDVLLQALVLMLKEKNVMNWKAIFVGSGNEQDQFNSFVLENQLTDKVIAMGELPNDQLKFIYSELDLFIFPTQLEESLGLVGLEAMAAGCITIASKIGALPYYVEHNQNGFLVEPGNPRALVDSIYEFNSLDLSEKKRISENARLTGNKFDENIISNQFIDNLSKLI